MAITEVSAETEEEVIAAVEVRCCSTEAAMAVTARDSVTIEVAVMVVVVQ